MKKIIINAFAVLTSALLFSSCVKEDVKDAGGKTFVRFLGGGAEPVVFAMDVDPTIEELTILDLRRDAANNAELNQPTTITITNTQAYLDEYNDENGTAYELLPSNSYTITSASGVAVSGDTWTVNFASGEFAREIGITLDKSQLDLSRSYAFGVKVTNTTVGVASLENGFSIVNVLVKNKYDGAYTVTGTMVDAANGALTGVFPMDYNLETTGAASVIGFDPTLNHDYYVPILNAGAGSVYGQFVPIFTFDANDKVISVTNGYGQPSANGRSAVLDPSGINAWDPATGDIDVKFWMDQPSVIAGHRTAFSWHMSYEGPR